MPLQDNGLTHYSSLCPSGGCPVHVLPSALKDLEHLHHRISSRRPAFFLDFDGTLTPLVQRPEMASLSWASRTVIASLAEHFLVAIISGRDRLEVEKLVGLQNLIYAGSHGFDVILPDGRIPEHSGLLNDQVYLDRAVAFLRHRLASVPGSLIERKRFTVAVHTRNVPQEYIKIIEGIVRQILTEEHPAMKLTTGKMVYELQPNVDWDKGKAVLWILQTLDINNTEVIPIFFGDDVTDEYAFNRIKNQGIGIIVANNSESNRTTCADFRVNDPDEVIKVLRYLQEYL